MKNNVNTLQDMLQLAEKKTGLSIVKIETAPELETYLEAGLARLYGAVFAEPPYLENFSVEESKNIFRDYLRMKGTILIGVDPDNGGRPVAFSVAVPLSAEPDIARQVNGKLGAGDATYIADAGVEPSYRRRNISVTLKEILLATAKEAGLAQGLSRTSQESYKQISAFNKVGGRVLSGIFQDVASKRLDGSVSQDRRIFYSFDLNNQKSDAASAEKFDNVRIVRKDGKDTAYVRDVTLWLERAGYAEWIKECYPNVSKVRFGRIEQRIGKFLRNVFKRKAKKDQGTEVFNGRLYLSSGSKPAALKPDPSAGFGGMPGL